MDEALEAYLKELLSLVEKHHLAELSLEGPDFKIMLRTAEALPQAAPAPYYPPPGANPGLCSVAPTAPLAAAVPSHLHELRSPLVGVFYRSASAEAPPFVEVGTYVQAGHVVCLIEAMKVFNEIVADRAGRVVEIPVTDGVVVEADQVLLLLDPHATKPEEG